MENDNVKGLVKKIIMLENEKQELLETLACVDELELDRVLKTISGELI